jgi:hypothetical protein
MEDPDFQEPIDDRFGSGRSHQPLLYGEWSGQSDLGTRTATIPKGFEQAISKIPRSRVALETGTHSPWVSRQLTQFGHEVIAVHAQNVRLIGESQALGSSPLRTRCIRSIQVDEIRPSPYRMTWHISDNWIQFRARDRRKKLNFRS